MKFWLYQVESEVFDDEEPTEKFTSIPGRIYAWKNDPRCPVAAFKLYLSKLHPEENRIWQRPLKSDATHWDSKKVWYYKKAQGK